MALPIAALRTEIAALQKKLGEPDGSYCLGIEPFPRPDEPVEDFEARYAAFALRLLRPAKVKIKINLMSAEQSRAVFAQTSEPTQEVAALLREEFAGAGPQDAARRVDTAPEPLDPLS